MNTRTATRLFVLFLLGLFLSPTFAIAQETSTGNTDQKYWLSVGLGLGVLPGADDQDVAESLAGSLTATYQFGSSLVSGRTAFANELFRDSVYDIGLLYGRVLSEGPVFASVGAGIGYVDGVRSEGLFSDPEPMSATIGLPLEIQVFIHPLRNVGVGFSGFANVNSEESFLGGAVSIRAGVF